MSKEEVTAKVTELVNSGITQIGAIMKEFSTLPADKKMVSESIKELIKQ
jgi:helix-turn-helix protein